MKGYSTIRKKALEILNAELPAYLYYHSIDHTLDVLKVCNEYIQRDNIGEHEAKLLRMGAVLHDIGFTVSTKNHEEFGVEIAEKMMKEQGFPEKDIAVVRGLIRATRIPQNPQNALENIICDADLDYLGKNNYYEISDLLYQELRAQDMISSEEQWMDLQISFLESHEYHTEFARKHRQPKKEKRLKELQIVTKD